MWLESTVCVWKRKAYWCSCIMSKRWVIRGNLWNRSVCVMIEFLPGYLPGALTSESEVLQLSKCSALKIKYMPGLPRAGANYISETCSSSRRTSSFILSRLINLMEPSECCFFIYFTHASHRKLLNPSLPVTHFLRPDGQCTPCRLGTLVSPTQVDWLLEHFIQTR